MTNAAASPRIFYGWWMVLVSCITMAAGPILITGTFGIFLKPLAETFGWSRSAISFAFSLVALMVALYAPVVGTFVDRFGPRKVIVCGAVVFGSGFCSFWFLSGLAAFGKIFGWLFGAFAFGAVLGPLLMGWVFDTTGSYQIALMILIPATAVGAVLMLPLGSRGWGLGIGGWEKEKGKASPLPKSDHKRLARQVCHPE